MDEPKVIGQYVLYGEIGAGGMATVYVGRLRGPAGFSRTVAIKRLHQHFAKNPNFVAMFLDEARLTASLRHPNVVPTIDVVSTKEDVLLVMEYVAGETLAHLQKHIRRQKELMPPPVVAAIMSGVLRGLHAAHEAQGKNGELLEMVHRDMSPENIMVGNDGVARILDFGIAKAEGQLHTTRQGVLKGKLAYMPPEQLHGKTLDRRADVYAASVVLWEALTGERMHTGTDAQIFGKVLKGCTTPPSRLVPSLDKALDTLTLRGLALEPAHRFATALEMARQLERCVQIAAPSDVSDWLEAHAGELLRKRASRIAKIESMSRIQAAAVAAPPEEEAAADAPAPRAPLPPSAEDDDAPTTNDLFRGKGPPAAVKRDAKPPASITHLVAAPPVHPAPVLSGAAPRPAPVDPDATIRDFVDAPTVEASVLGITGLEAPPVVAPVLPATPSDDEPTAEAAVPARAEVSTPPPRWQIPKLAIAAPVLAAAAVAVLLLVSGNARTVSPPAATVAATSVALPVTMAPPRPSAPGAEDTRPTPSAAPQDEVLSAGEIADPAPSAGAIPAASQARDPQEPPREAGPKRENCNPPYYFDASGLKHYKRHCG